MYTFIYFFSLFLLYHLRLDYIVYAFVHIEYFYVYV